jgi:hypothetical protein
MEYLIGSLLTFVLLLSLGFIFNRKKKNLDLRITYSQSHVHELIRPFIPDNEELTAVKITQASKHYDQIHIRILMVQNKAYWIKNSVLYVADIINGDIDKDSTKEVDIISMDRVQLDKMMFIVDKLTEGTTNDYWNTGK